jgi:hypothetical protein
MTRDEIIAKWTGLSARERDVWTAEVVFGWEWRAEDGEDAGWYERVNNAPFYDRVFTGRRHGWSPSTDISAAWPIFERYWSVEIAKISGAVDTYGARINDSDGQVRAMTQELTAPEALCLAALIVELNGGDR